MRISALCSAPARWGVVLLVAASFWLWREGDIATLVFAQEPTAPAPTEQPRFAREITAVLREQQEAWNRGDVESFMEHYLKSDQLTFSSGGKVTRGWQATLDRYRRRYPDRGAMGQLEFSGLEFRSLGETAALVLGNWQLEREEQEDVGGNFTLVLEKLEGKWVIVHDHTSRRE
jgi:ketosteroid isomerase-like protein